MTRRLDIELTSQRPDGTWTWRAAQARQPKGEIPAELLPASAEIGTLLKAEVAAGLDGLEIVRIAAPRQRSEPSDRIELIVDNPDHFVTANLVKQTRRQAQPRERRGDRSKHGPDKHGRPRAGGDRRHGDASETRGADRAKHDRKRGRSQSREGDGRRSGQQEPRRGDKRDRRPQRRAASSSADGGERRGGRRAGGTSQAETRTKAPLRPKAPALKPKGAHRDAALKELPEDQRAVAREVMRGGVPALRSVIDRMNQKATAAGMPNIPTAPLIALGEKLAPKLKAAEWHDRADAALAGIATIDLRDIRSVIAAADRSARTAETRALAASLREGFAARLEEDQRKWLDELAVTVSGGRTVRALRLSSRPPKAGAPVPVDIAERLVELTAADLTATTSQQRWTHLLESLAYSPVRSRVVPSGVPEAPNDELLSVVRRYARQLPQIAKLFAVSAEALRRGGPRQRSSGPPKPRAKGRPAAQARTGAQAETAAQAQASAQPEAASGEPEGDRCS